MAGIYARALLSEIETTTLDKFLLTLDALHEQEEPSPTGIVQIDEALKPVLTTQLQQHQQHHSHLQAQHRTQHTSFPQRSHPPTIEIAGLGPCSGKTQLLYSIAASLLLDQDINTRKPRNGGLVIWIDCAGRFSIGRVNTILQNIQGEHQKQVISSASPSSTHLRQPFSADTDHLTSKQSRLSHLKESPNISPPATNLPIPLHDLLSSQSQSQPNPTSPLTHLHIHAPQTFSELLSILHSIPETLLRPTPRKDAHHPATLSQNRRVAALIIADLDSFHAEVRAEGERVAIDRSAAIDRSTAVPTTALPTASTLAPHVPTWPTPASFVSTSYTTLATAVRSVQTALGCAVFASVSARPKPSSWNLVEGREIFGGEEIVTEPPGAWTRVLDGRIVVGRTGNKNKDRDRDGDGEAEGVAEFEGHVWGRAGRMARVGFEVDGDGVRF